MRAAAVCFMLALATEAAFAQRPSVPSSAMPGRERQQLLIQPDPATPRIQMQGGRPAPVIQNLPPQPPKRRKRRR